MSDNKYLLTTDECNVIKYLHTVGAVRSFMKEHEYHERTCQMTRLMSVGRTDFVCDQCDHCTCYTKPNFCPTCGAKVVEP